MEKEVCIGRQEMDRFEESMELSQFAFQYVRSPQELDEARARVGDEPSDVGAVCEQDVTKHE